MMLSRGKDGRPLVASRPGPSYLGQILVPFRGHCGKPSCPNKATDLWAYLAFMLSGGEHGDWSKANDA